MKGEGTAMAVHELGRQVRDLLEAGRVGRLHGSQGIVQLHQDRALFEVGHVDCGLSGGGHGQCAERWWGNERSEGGRKCMAKRAEQRA